MASVQSYQMLAAAAAACEDKKAEDIRILALDPTESGLTDFFLICTGSNDRQTVAITDEIELRLKREFSTYPNSVEGRRQGEWILMDYVDFIVHVFLPEKRAYYGLERLRPSATSLSVDGLNAEIKAAITAKRPAKAARKTPSDVDAQAPEPAIARGTPASSKGAARKSTGAKAAAKSMAVPKRASAKTVAKKVPAKVAKAPAKRPVKAVRKRTPAT